MTRLLKLAASLALVLAFPLTSQAIDVTPTANDYGLIDQPPGSTDPLRPDYLWIDIVPTGELVTAAGTNISSLNSGIGQPVDLPYPFPFYGKDYQQIVPCNNGYLSFDTDSETGSDFTPQCNPALPNVGKGARIYALHGPINLDKGIYFQYFEKSPHPHRACGVSIFTWHQTKHLGSGSVGDFQALLFDNGDIIIQHDVNATGNPTPTTIGIVNDKHDEGIDFSCATTPPALPGRSILFRAPMVTVSDGAGLAGAIASVRNGGKVRFTNLTAGIGSSIIVPATIDIDKAVCIDADDHRVSTLSFRRRSLDGDQKRRIFDVNSNGRLLMVSGGLKHASANNGGAIRVNGGSLKICDADIHHNRSSSNGGAIIVSSGDAQFHNCNFWRNSAASSGGAIFTEADGIRVNACSFFDNHARFGGAIQLDITNDPSTIVNSTFTRNTAEDDGAAILLVESSAAISHSTIAGNGGANNESTVYCDESDLTLSHNIFGTNTGLSYERRSTFSGIISFGNNIDSSDDYGLDPLNDEYLNVDAQLSPLGLHGGRVFTMHPLFDSPAVDGGQSTLSSAPLVDARGLPRLADSDADTTEKYDIGAVECGTLLTVTTGNDEYDIGSNTAALALREAIEQAAEGSRITFLPSLSGANVTFDVAYGFDGGIPTSSGYNVRVDQRSLFIDGSNLSAPPNIRRSSAAAHQLFWHSDEADIHALSFHSVTLEHGIDLKVANLYDCDAATVFSTFLGIDNTSPVFIDTSFARINDCIFNNTSIGVNEMLNQSSLLPRIASIINTDGPADIESPTVEIFDATIDGGFIRVDSEHFVAADISGDGSLSAVGSLAGYTSRSVRIERCALVGGSGGLNLITEDLVLADSIVAGKNNAPEDVLTLAASELGLVTNLTVSGNRVEKGYCLPGRETIDSPMIVDGPVTLEHCTIYDNILTLVPGGVECPVPPATSGGLRGSQILKNSIVARNRVIDEVFSTSKIDNLIELTGTTSLGNNLFDTNELSDSGIAQADDIEGEAPWLFPLRDNGGPFPTHQPMAASPAIDAVTGASSTPLTDARGYLRTVNGGILNAADIGAVEATVPITVKTQNENAPGINTLRDALAASQSGPAIGFPRRILFALPASPTIPTLALNSTLVVTEDTTLDASSLPRGFTIDGGGTHKLMILAGDITVNMAGITFANGTANDGGAMTSSADLLITNCAFVNNSATDDGGAIQNAASDSAFYAINSTFSGNTATDEGAVMINAAQIDAISFRHCTFADNTAGAGEAVIHTRADTSTFYANLFADNSPADYELVSGIFVNLGYNMTDSPTPLQDPQPTDATNALALLEPLADNGGLSKTHALGESSEAIDAGPGLLAAQNDPSLLDARGFIRQLLTPTGRIDIGAHETASQDSDGDLMPDDWEIANALDPSDPTDADDDNDFDGINNLAEFQGGTLPWDNYSQNIEPAPNPILGSDGAGGIEIQWNSIPLTPPTGDIIFYTYQIECSTDLVTWVPYGAPIDGIDGPLSAPITIDGVRKFFRIHFNIDFAGQDLMGTDLSNIDLSSSDLSGANISGANLVGTNLIGANTTGTIFTAIPTDGFARAAEAFPEMMYPPDGANFSELPDVGLVSHNTLLLLPELSATPAEINALLATHSGNIIGGIRALTEDDPGLLIARFPTANHAALDPVVAAFDASPAIQIVSRDSILETKALPDLSSAQPTWSDFSSVAGTPGNIGMHLAKVPQMWNLNGQIEARGPSNVKTGIIDVGFDTAHPDIAVPLSQNDVLGLPGGFPSFCHGTHVAGIIGASQADGTSGVNGVNPFAQIVATTGIGFNQGFASNGFRTVGEFYTDIIVLQIRRANTRVINLSLGDCCPAAGVNAAYIQRITNDASLFQQVFYAQAAPLPLLVVASGNESEHVTPPLITIDSRHGGPLNWSSIVNLNPYIMCVDAVGGSLSTAPPHTPTLAWFTNIGGTIAAPGVSILSSSSPSDGVDALGNPSPLCPSPYASLNGTSMAAPHVTGVASYLLAIDPALTALELRAALLASADSVTGFPANFPPMLDAYGAALEIDTIRGNDTVLRMLLDNDDGTLDGNQRVQFTVDVDADEEGEDPTIPFVDPFTENDEDGNFRAGDGVVDMSDFRQFRDLNAIAQALYPSGAVGSIGTALDGLDGPVDHPKNDPNRNGHSYTTDIQSGKSQDAYYPVTDFNGDGLPYNDALQEIVDGAMGGGVFDDLEVLESRFADLFYEPGDLADLMPSADVHLNLYWFAKAVLLEQIPDLVNATIRVREAGTNSNEFLETIAVPDLHLEGADLVLTFATGKTYEISVWGMGDETAFFGETWTFNFDTPLEDHWFAPRPFVGFDPND